MEETSLRSRVESRRQTVKAMQGQQTRTRIRQTALALFNDHGTVGVTTHDIARAAALSPGNLYYHYRNKEEIVREIFETMEIYSSEKWYELGPMNPRVGIMDFMRFFVGQVWNYRFFFREFSTLLQNDPTLASFWSVTYERLFQAMRAAATKWVERGILKPFADAAEMDAFIENCWLVVNFSSVHLEWRQGRRGGGASDSYDKRLHLLLAYLHPYQKVQKVRPHFAR